MEIAVVPPPERAPDINPDWVKTPFTGFLDIAGHLRLSIVCRETAAFYVEDLARQWLDLINRPDDGGDGLGGLPGSGDGVRQ